MIVFVEHVGTMVREDDYVIGVVFLFVAIFVMIRALQPEKFLNPSSFGSTMEMFASLGASVIVQARLIDENLQAERMAAIGQTVAGLSHYSN